MCKIILKFGNCLTKKEMEDHRERNEDGAGVAFLDKDGTLGSVRDLKHSEVYSKLDKVPSRSPFWLFHSRMPSAGSIRWSNIQPFVDKEMAFAHNGTVSVANLFHACMAGGIGFDSGDSDSRLLFRIMQKNSTHSNREYLKQIDDNFVLISHKAKEVFIWGKFDLETDKAGKSLLMAKNGWSPPACCLILDYSGRIKQIWQEKKKVYGKYSGTGYVGFDQRVDGKITDSTGYYESTPNWLKPVMWSEKEKAWCVWDNVYKVFRVSRFVKDEDVQKEPATLKRVISDLQEVGATDTFAWQGEGY